MKPPLPEHHGTDNPLQQARDRALSSRLRRDESLLTGAMDAIETAAAVPEWASAVTVYDRVATMSADEVLAWTEEVERLTRRHVRRCVQAAETGDGGRRLPVHLLFYGFPTRPTPPARHSAASSDQTSVS